MAKILNNYMKKIPRSRFKEKRGINLLEIWSLILYISVTLFLYKGGSAHDLFQLVEQI